MNDVDCAAYERAKHKIAIGQANPDCSCEARAIRRANQCGRWEPEDECR